MKKFWLTLFPNTFIWIKNNGIVYNATNFKYIIFKCTSKIRKLYTSLIDLENLYSVEITESLLSHKEIKQMVDGIIGIEAGCLIENDGLKKKLVSFYPYLKIQNDVRQIELRHKHGTGGEIINNLHELIFHINGTPNGSMQYFKQMDYPLKSNLSLDFKPFLSFMHQCNYRMLNKVTFIGDLFNYKYYLQLQNWILANDYLSNLVILDQDFEKNISKTDWINSDNINITLVVRRQTEFFYKIKHYVNLPFKIAFSFPVTTRNQFDLISQLVKEVNLTNYSIIPIFNGKNHKFFEENIYLNSDDFKEISLSKREVFANMALNTYSFGKLTIMPDGRLFSNVNDPSLGSIYDPIYNLLYKEMTKRKTWLRIRDMKPCCDCVYQWLCPSPGNYELVTGISNLCHILPG